MEARPREREVFPYHKFIEGEGLPVHRAAVGLDDLTALPRAPWARTGGLGAFVELQGAFESERGIYVGEIPARGALEPERHLYEEEVFILEGHGISEVWQDGRDKLTFEWAADSIFAVPRNCWHRLYNGGSRPAIFVAVTTAPAVMNCLDDVEFVFNSDYRFRHLYGDEPYFKASDLYTVEGQYKQAVWHTNFIADARKALVDALEQKVSGGQLTEYRMGKRFPHGHISQWPEGRYHKAHYHGPGAILLGLDGEGYVLAWPSEWGPRPYQDGRGGDVHKVPWRRHSIYSPPDGYFHQHFNTGHGPARHVAVYGADLPLAMYGLESDEGWLGYVSVRSGGTLIEYEDEDPQIRQDFERELASQGIACATPPV